jgi:hypothetical protein
MKWAQKDDAESGAYQGVLVKKKAFVKIHIGLSEALNAEGKTQVKLLNEKIKLSADS